ncbi:MAG: hypothetical protein E7A81_01125 [Clostridiales bacterium]|nr:hypothetical protein [Clostridiales bacterium]MDU1041484.1 hypothetical protein [Clostridiales bacterium]
MANILIVSTNRKLTNGASLCILSMAEWIRAKGHDPMASLLSLVGRIEGF